MRRLLVVVVVLPLVLVGGLGAFRVLDREYRYHELVTLGDGLLSDELPLEAARTYSAAIELKPDEPIGYVKRSDAHRARGDLAPALSDLEKARELSGDELLVASRLAELFSVMERFDEAALEYGKILAHDPDADAVLYELALVHFRAGRDSEAIDALNRAASLREGFWEALYLRGSIFRSIGGLGEAERDFRKAVELAPDAELPRAALIELYLDPMAGEPKADARALEMIRTEIDRNPGDPRPYLHLADAHRIAGRTQEAIAAVGRALEQDPNLPAAYLRLGELWLEEAQQRDDAVANEKAVSALLNVVKMDPTSGAAALALGRAYLALGDDVRGFAELQRAAQATPVQAEALRLLGDLYRARNNPSEAVTVYHVYLKLAGDTPAVLERLGDAYLEDSRPALAAEVYMRLSTLEPRRVGHLVKAARAFLESGDPESAARACRLGLAANPENRVLLELLAESRSGQGLPRTSDSSISP